MPLDWDGCQFTGRPPKVGIAIGTASLIGEGGLMGTPGDFIWMGRALALARKGLGKTSPNPAVGAVLVRGGRCLGEGWHRKAGGDHAEIVCLKAALRAGHRSRGATLYVTLEPCSTHGRTPPCCEAIVEAGVARVVVGATDPNPRHAGRAYRWLRRRGVEVLAGVMAEECTDLNRAFNHWVTTGQPWVVLKLAMSADGSLDRPDGVQWLTGPAARKDVHRLRASCDAILVGAETVRQDNPRLDVRGVPTSRQPLRVIVTRSGNVPGSSHVLDDPDRVQIFRRQSWKNILLKLGRRGVTKLLVEGGARTADSLIRARRVNELITYHAPMDFTGDTKRTRPTRLGDLICTQSQTRRMGPDTRVMALVVNSSSAGDR